MPLYAYRCKNCGYEFEERQRMMDDPLTECPHCAEQALRRVIDKVGVVFKGSGFYVTDTKSNNPAAPSTDKTEKPAESLALTGGKAEKSSPESAKPAETKSEKKAKSEKAAAAD